MMEGRLVGRLPAGVPSGAGTPSPSSTREVPRMRWNGNRLLKRPPRRHSELSARPYESASRRPETTASRGRLYTLSVAASTHTKVARYG